jgi:hypothetical protein
MRWMEQRGAWMETGFAQATVDVARLSERQPAGAGGTAIAEGFGWK